jgi:hypothetical protein
LYEAKAAQPVAQIPDHRGLLVAKLVCLAMLCIAATLTLSQARSTEPESATIVKVAPHEKTAEKYNITQYDVSLKVRDTIYVVLYSPPTGANGVEYAVGQNVVVIVGPKTITFSKLGTAAEVPILHREDVSSDSGIEWSRAPGEYFSLKLRHLSDQLDLSPEQQSTIKPVLEAEAGQAGAIMGNPVLSAKDKLERFEQIVRSSDEKLKPTLTTEQWGKLQELRKAQKAELAERIDPHHR